MSNKWLDRTLIASPKYTLCTNKKDFDKICKRLQCDEHVDWISRGSGATCHTFYDDDEIVSVICIELVKPTNQTRALLVHECIHIWETVIECMNESKPSSEFTAYSIQTLTLNVLNEYDRQWDNRKGKKK